LLICVYIIFYLYFYSPQSVACYGYVDAKKPGTSFTDSRCTVCSKERKNMIDLQRIYTLGQREIKKKLKKQKSIGRVKNITRKNSRLNNKVCNFGVL